MRLAFMVFAITIAVAAALVIVTAPALPELVASHFGPDNRPDGWMARDGYVLLALSLAVVVPVLEVVVVALLARRAPRLVNMPHRDYWFAAERRDATIASLTTQALWLGVFLAIFMTAVHWLVLTANVSKPPQLPAGAFWGVLALFVAAIVVWAALFYLRFRVPRDRR
jgi:uncharacterized membrane protein